MLEIGLFDFGLRILSHNLVAYNPIIYFKSVR